MFRNEFSKTKLSLRASGNYDEPSNRPVPTETTVPRVRCDERNENFDDFDGVPREPASRIPAQAALGDADPAGDDASAATKAAQNLLWRAYARTDVVTYELDAQFILRRRSSNRSPNRSGAASPRTTGGADLPDFLDLDVRRTLGTGAFGRVKLCSYQPPFGEPRVYALKMLASQTDSRYLHGEYFGTNFQRQSLQSSRSWGLRTNSPRTAGNDLVLTAVKSFEEFRPPAPPVPLHPRAGPGKEDDG